MARKRKNNKVAKVHEEMQGLDLKINEFGEMVSNIDMDKLNEFLTRTVPDKKLMHRTDDQYQQDFKAEEGANMTAPDADFVEALGPIEDEDVIEAEENFEKFLAGEQDNKVGDLTDSDQRDAGTPKGTVTSKKKRDK
ncbi:MAG: hypothetical protein SGJ04_07205 [Bacteroidota bacterium]|nr:hypothetical protein [Bacteroidota bacterium]